MLKEFRLGALAALALVSFLAGCAGVVARNANGEPPHAVASAAPGAPAPAAPGTAAPTPTPSPHKAFADVIKDAKEEKGLFTLYRKDDRVWIEIAPEQFDRPYFMSVNLSQGLGEKMFFGGLMGPSTIVSFHKSGNLVQLVARNTRFFARAGTPEERAVSEAFSDSLLGSAPIASQPNVQRKSILIEANALLLADIMGANGMLEAAYHQGYTFDPRNSSITATRTSAELVTFNVRAHYAAPRVAPPKKGPDGGTQIPATVPDARSLFLGFYYNFAKLPNAPMHPRLADDRIGYFIASRYDYSNDNARSPLVNYIQRWRLEKKDPTAALSEPEQPIVFWLDRTIPERYRQTVMNGVLEWNKAFERIGFKNAIVAKLQPEDADFDTVDARHASVRWMTSARPAFGGIGPRQVDPRTGEILDADIGIDPVRLRNRRLQRVEGMPTRAAPTGIFGQSDWSCAVQDYSAQELGFALDLLEARGDILPDSPEAEAFVLADLKDVVMHEVGHALGLRHNFRASTVYTQAQLSDRTFTEKNGIAGSVMEYNATNIALPGEAQGSYSMTTLGPYDYWAIEYGYKEIPAGEEVAELKKIASRSSDPLLAFATDEDASFAIDPEANLSDLGNDPLQFARRRLLLTHELWDRWENTKIKAGENQAVLRRSVNRGLQAMGLAAATVAKYVGGVTTLRDHAGSPREPLTPLPASRQREALNIIETGLFSADSFKFKPEFMRRMQADYLERDDIYRVGLAPDSVDYSLPTQVLNVQRQVLEHLFSDAVAQRIIDSEAKLDDPKRGFRLSELYSSLRNAIWSELKTGRDIDSIRRNLQREHVRRLALLITQAAPTTPADARSLARENAQTLLTQIKTAKKRRGFSEEARAHLAESEQTLEQALRAPIQRTI